MSETGSNSARAAARTSDTELADVDGVARSLYVRQDSVARNPYGTPSSSIAAARTAHAAGAAAVATAAISFSA